LHQLFREPATLAALLPREGNHLRGADVASLAFNHPLYPRGDPRAGYLLETIRGLDSRSTRVRNLLGYLDVARDQHKLHPRVEAAMSVLALALSMPVGAASGIVTLGRIAGWVAHIAEQRLGGFLIRPRAKFMPPAA